MGAPTLTDDGGDWLDVGLNAGSMGGDSWNAGLARSTWDPVAVASPARDESEFAFAGMHGVFSEPLGMRGRQIRWSGMIRAEAAAFAAIRTDRDEWLAKDGLMTFTDDLGVDYENCRLDSFEIAPPTPIVDDDIVDYVAAYEIVMTQLET